MLVRLDLPVRALGVPQRGLLNHRVAEAGRPTRMGHVLSRPGHDHSDVGSKAKRRPNAGQGYPLRTSALERRLGGLWLARSRTMCTSRPV